MVGPLRPLDGVEMPDAAATDREPFGDEQRPLQAEVAAETAQHAAGGNDAMVREARCPGRSHDVANSPSGARFARQARDRAIRGDTADRYPAHDAQNTPRKPRVNVRC